MRPISLKNRKAIDSDPYYKTCARSSERNCNGKITIEHCIIFAGRQLDELWSMIPLCTYHHAVNEHQDGGGLQKEKNVWIALNRATEAELSAVSKAINYKVMKDRLNKIYGTANLRQQK